MDNYTLINNIRKQYPNMNWDMHKDIAFDRHLFSTRLKEMQIAEQENKNFFKSYHNHNKKNNFLFSLPLLKNANHVGGILTKNIKIYKKILKKLMSFTSIDNAYCKAIYNLEYLYIDTISSLANYNPFYRYAPAGNQSYQSYHGREDDLFLRYNKPSPERPITEYRRNGTIELEKFESQIAQALNINTDNFCMLATSSACSAFVTLLSYIRFSKNKNLKILVPDTCYSEFLDILRKDHTFDISFYSIKEPNNPDISCLEACKKEEPDILLLETISNNLNNRFVDIQNIISKIRSDPNSSINHIICDDTLTPTSFSDINQDNLSDLNIYRITSGCKYLNMGMDRISCGLLMAPKKDEKSLKTEFRTLWGSTLYEESHKQFPRSLEMLHQRNQQIERNAILFCEIFNMHCNDLGFIAKHPRASTHADYLRLQNKSDVFTGGIVTISYIHKDIDDEKVFYICEKIIEKASSKKIDIVFGTSFGHTIPRVWPCRLPANDKGIRYRYFRYYAGARSIEETLAATMAIIETIKEHISSL